LKIDMTVTNEGLRIELSESASGTFFDSGSAKISPDGAEILIALAHELGKLPNKIALEGHTDAKQYPAGSNFGNWERSTERANAARRLTTQNGIGLDQVTQVRGFADQRLRKKDAPMDPSNRRISLIVQYMPKKPADPADKSSDKSGETSGEKSDDKPGEKSPTKPGEKSTPDSKTPAAGKPATNSKPAPETPANSPKTP
jgi:chemotaxis protein MotB